MKVGMSALAQCVQNRSNSRITMRVVAKESPGGAYAHLSAQCVPQVVCMVVCMVQHMQEPTPMLGQHHGRECDLRILWERMQVLCPTGLRRRSKVDRESARREPSSSLFEKMMTKADFEEHKRCHVAPYRCKGDHLRSARRPPEVRTMTLQWARAVAKGQCRYKSVYVLIKEQARSRPG